MADHGISGSFCFECRDRKAKEREPVPCEAEGRCWLTRREPDDEEAPMQSPWPGQFIIDLWERIIALSAMQRIERKRDEKTMMIYYLPTLEKLEAVLDETDWATAPVDRFTAIEMIGRFQNWYLGFKIN